jgi:hypothetical protein
MLLSQNVIKIFSVLDERITIARVHKFYGGVVVIFVICSIPMVIFFIFDVAVESAIGKIANYMGTVVPGLSVVIDEIQSGYITYMVFQGGRKLKAFEALVMTILYLIVQIIVDWSAVGVQLLNLSLQDNFSGQDDESGFATDCCWTRVNSFRNLCPCFYPI